MTISTNSTTTPTAKVSLSGKGTAASSTKLAVSTTAIAFGNVVLTQSESQPVKLSSTGTTPVTISSVALSGANFTVSGATFPVTLSPGVAVTLNVLFKPTSAGAETGKLTISSNSTAGSTSVVALSGSGDHQVTLAWSAPASSPVAVVGYNIYRAAGTSASYAKINTSTVAQTSYMDTTVLAGSTYSYEVKSLNSTGLESSASNKSTVVIP